MQERTHTSPHGRLQSFKKYFFEFLMIFLAVAAGFLSENIREDFADKKKGLEYIQSVTEDLRLDISTLDSIITVRQTRDVMLDSLLHLLNEPDISKHGNDIYYYSRLAPRVYRFYSHDRTIIQLRSSGDWHLIQKKEVSDALQLYDERVRSLTNYITEREESLIQIMYPSLNNLFDNKSFNQMLKGLGVERPNNNPQLRTMDKNKINEFANQIHFLKNANQFFISYSKTLLKSAKNTLSLIEMEYRLTDSVDNN